MNIQTKSVLVAAIAALAVTPLIAKTGGKFGTNILHFMVRVPMTNDGVESNATGTVTASQATQGNADKETLTVTAKGLTSSTNYSLFVSTKTSGLTDVDDFTTDAKGNAAVKLTNGKLGKNGVALSSNAVPVSSIQEVVIENGASQPVLTADFTNATSLQYLVKQNISTNSTSALLQIKSTENKGTSKTSFSLKASGLDTNTDYLLDFNGSTVQTNTSDSRGNLNITSAPTPTNILDLTSVDVTQTNGTPVTGTATLP